MQFAVTTGQKNSLELNNLAQQWAKDLAVDFIERQKGTLEQMLKEHNLTAVVIATANGPQLYSVEGRLFFHPGLSALRIKNILSGQGDRLINAMHLTKGMKVLDCTLGLASDASVISYIIGDSGKIIGLEASKAVAFVIKEGLQNYKSNDINIGNAYKRIETINIKAYDYLKILPDKSFEVIYFDPMFEQTIKQSSNIKPLKAVAVHGCLDDRTIHEAKRVAKNRIVIKMNKYAKVDIKNLVFTEDGKYSSVKYGVIEVANER